MSERRAGFCGTWRFTRRRYCMRRTDTAVEVHSWSPRPDDPTRAAFARVLISAKEGRAKGWGTHVAGVVRQVLHARQLDAIVMRGYNASPAIWIPFADGPSYDVLRAWLHLLVTDVVTADSAIDAAELHVSTNAIGRWSLVPYSLIGPDGTTALTPLRWAELEAIPGPLSTAALAKRLSNDVFDEEVRRIGVQRFGGGPVLMVSG